MALYLVACFLCLKTFPVGLYVQWTLHGFSFVFHIIDLTNSSAGISCSEFFLVFLAMVIVVKVDGDSVDLKVIETLLVFSFCMVRCLSVSWFLKSKFSFFKREILTLNFVSKICVFEVCHHFVRLLFLRLLRFLRRIFH